MILSFYTKVLGMEKFYHHTCSMQTYLKNSNKFMWAAILEKSFVEE